MKVAYRPPACHDTFSPLFFDRGEEVYPAFLQLDCRTGEVTFDVRWDHVASEEEDAGHVLRWSVPANLLGSRLEAIVTKLGSYLQRVVDGYREEFVQYSLRRTYGELDDEAKSAREYIRWSLSEESFSSDDLAPVWTADELAEWAGDEITPGLTDDEIEKLADDCCDHFSDQVLILGCASQAFRERRDALR